MTPHRNSAHSPPQQRQTGLQSSTHAQTFEKLAELIPKFGPFQGKLNRRLQHAELIASVKPFAVECITKYLLLLQQRFDSVSELNLPAGSGPGLFQQLEDLRREHIAANNRLLGWCIFQFRLLHHASTVIDLRIARILLSGQNAIRTDASALDGHRRQHRSAALIEYPDHL